MHFYALHKGLKKIRLRDYCSNKVMLNIDTIDIMSKQILNVQNYF